MKKLPIAVITLALLAMPLAGCSSTSTTAETADVSATLVEEGEGTTPEAALPLGGAYLLEDGVEILIGAPTDVTLSGFTADEYDLSAGTPIGISITFINRGDSELTSGGVFVEMTSGGVSSQVVLNSEARRVFHAGSTASYSEEDLLEMAPLTLKPGKPYTFQLEFIPADPDDFLLEMSRADGEPIYFTNS